MKSVEDFMEMVNSDTSSDMEASLCVLWYHWILIAEILNKDVG